MTSFWSSHAGVNYEEILGEMPKAIRISCVMHVSKEPVDWFIKTVIEPTCWEVEGSIARAMYFVLRGHLQLHSRSLLALTRPIGLRRGDFFGERGLLGSAISTYTVRSVRA
eukprot:jgi/Phyca11/51937/gw1.42.273.1